MESMVVALLLLAPIHGEAILVLAIAAFMVMAKTAQVCTSL